MKPDPLALLQDAYHRAAGMEVAGPGIHGWAGPLGWTHTCSELRATTTGGLEIVLASRDGARYFVGPDYCSCEHSMFRCQPAGAPAICKHSAWAFPGGKPRPGLALPRVESAEERRELAAASVAATFGAAP
jgi:hypothetical protein